MIKVVVASNNEHKIKEIKEILNGFPMEVISQREAGVDIEVEENGTTFMENAYKKAKEIYDILKNKEEYAVLADDSGLMVDALGGAPGVYSARFAGEHGNSRKNNEKLLSLLKGIPFAERKGRFVCAMVLIIGEDKVLKAQGEVEGYITDSEKGQDGFGYDPLFYVPEFNKTFSEVCPEDKNSVSHRGRALEKLVKQINKVLI
jgi:XTP/dITP diphosphohydrolase